MDQGRAQDLPGDGQAHQGLVGGVLAAEVGVVPVSAPRAEIWMTAPPRPRRRPRTGPPGPVVEGVEGASRVSAMMPTAFLDAVQAPAPVLHGGVGAEVDGHVVRAAGLAHAADHRCPARLRRVQMARPRKPEAPHTRMLSGLAGGCDRACSILCDRLFCKNRNKRLKKTGGEARSARGTGQSFRRMA
jgi:hypothetical protein